MQVHGGRLGRGGQLGVRHAPTNTAVAPPQVREAVQNNNFVAFFRLYHSAPLLGRALMDIVVPAVRCVRVVVAFFGGGGQQARRSGGLLA